MKVLKILLIIYLFVLSTKCLSQENLNFRSGSFNVNYGYLFSDESNDLLETKTGHNLTINRLFTVDRLLSIGPTIGFTMLNTVEKERSLSLGADAYFYPLYLFTRNDYNDKKEKFNFSIGYQKLINSNIFQSNTKINFYVYTFTISNKMHISPLMAAVFYSGKDRELPDLNYYSLGIQLKL